jgi:hypothetical protein
MSNLTKFEKWMNEPDDVNPSSPMGAPAELTEQHWYKWDRVWSEPQKNCARAFFKQKDWRKKLDICTTLDKEATLMTTYSGNQ